MLDIEDPLPYKGKRKTRTLIQRTDNCFTGTRILIKTGHYHALCTRQFHTGLTWTKSSSMNEFLLSIIAQLPLFFIRYSFSSSRSFYWYVEST